MNFAWFSKKISIFSIMANFEKEKFEAKTESFWNLYSCVFDFQRLQLEFVQTYQVCIWNRARCQGCFFGADRRIWGGARSSTWSIQPLDDRRRVYHNNRSPLKKNKIICYIQFYEFLQFCFVRNFAQFALKNPVKNAEKNSEKKKSKKNYLWREIL